VTNQSINDLMVLQLTCWIKHENDENVDLNMPHRPHDATVPADNDINPGVPVLHATPVSTEASDSTQATIGIPLPSPRNLSLAACVEISNAANPSLCVSSVPNGDKSNVYFVE